MSKDYFSFETSASSTSTLDAGKHNVRIVLAQQTTDRFADLGGITKKEVLPPWNDETPQLAITFGNNEGVITRRYSVLGYKTMADLTDEEIASGEYTAKSSQYGDENYACVEKKEGVFVRVISKPKTERARQMISDILAHAGVEPGQGVMDAIKSAIADKKQLSITVEETAYSIKRKEANADARSIFDVVRTGKYTADAVVEEAEVIEDDEEGDF